MKFGMQEKAARIIRADQVCVQRLRSLVLIVICVAFLSGTSTFLRVDAFPTGSTSSWHSMLARTKQSNPILITSTRNQAFSRDSSFLAHGPKRVRISVSLKSTGKDDYVNRRKLMQQTVSGLLFFTSIGSVGGIVEEASAFPLLGPKVPDRQLEYCIVAVMRVQYWAQDILARASLSEEDNVQWYVEARLGSKALLTGKTGGGANQRVYTLASFQLKDCLHDGNTWWGQLSNNKEKRKALELQDVGIQLVESLAACVEFDGLETTTDASPRSSLMRSMYNPQKGTFVKRMLAEQTIPACQRWFSYFRSLEGGPALLERCQSYIRTTYPNEVPPPPLPRPSISPDTISLDLVS